MIWPGLTPPYTDLFAWLEGAATSRSTAMALFRPVMLSHPIGDGNSDKLDAADYMAEWKWDGIRVQAVAGGESGHIAAGSIRAPAKISPEPSPTSRRRCICILQLCDRWRIAGGAR